jgi:putative effector of murein hydrolase LrgA (UPF0299 family)
MSHHHSPINELALTLSYTLSVFICPICVLVWSKYRHDEDAPWRLLVMLLSAVFFLMGLVNLIALWWTPGASECLCH